MSNLGWPGPYITTGVKRLRLTRVLSGTRGEFSSALLLYQWFAIDRYRRFVSFQKDVQFFTGTPSIVSRNDSRDFYSSQTTELPWAQHEHPASCVFPPLDDCDTCTHRRNLMRKREIDEFKLIHSRVNHAYSEFSVLLYSYIICTCNNVDRVWPCTDIINMCNYARMCAFDNRFCARDDGSYIFPSF